MPTSLKPIARRALAAQSDDRLVRLVRDGHEPAFEEVVRRYRAPLVAFATAIAGAAGAEDVVQAGLMRAHKALLADHREIALRPWLFAIVRNGALNAARDEPAWRELDPEQHEPGQAPATAEQREELEHLVNAICALPESQRQALVMREMEGVGHAEIAAKLHTSPTAVRGLIFRARTTLRNALGVLIPLPLLRWLLTDPTAAAAATGAATGAGAGGGGGAILGGAFGKAAVGLTAAVVAVGAGKAIDDRRSGDHHPVTGPATARAATGTGAGSGSGANRGQGGGESGRTGTAGTADDGRGERGEQAEERRERHREAAEEAREAREDRRDDREDRHDDGDDDAGDDSGSSGSSGSGGGHSGRGGGDDDDVDEVEDDDRVELEEPEVDDDDDDEDHSGSGSSRSGSDDDDEDEPDDD
jgi:RNA polymerase sigma factor (sigma-70 family)